MHSNYSAFLVTIDLRMAEPQCTEEEKVPKTGDEQTVIGDIKAGKHVEDIAREYGISKSQAYRIFQRKYSIVRAVARG